MRRPKPLVGRFDKLESAATTRASHQSARHGEGVRLRRGDSGSVGGFPVQEYEVSKSQAANWNRLNEKEQLTLVLKADREDKDLRDFL